jgi:hypothetical protein
MRTEYPSLREGLVFAWKGDTASTAPQDEVRRSRAAWNGTNPTLQYGGTNFDAVGNYVGVTERTGLSGNVPLTMSAWARPRTTAVGGVARFGGVSAGFRMLSGTWSFIGDNASVYGPTGGNGTITANTWQHVLHTYPGTKYEDSLCYFNGAGPFTVTRTNGTVNSGMNWVAGGASHIGMNNFTAYFPGQIADVRVYNRVLTLAEIRLLASRLGIGLSPLPDRAAGMPRKLFVNVGGTWRDGDAYVNTGSGWRLGVPFVNAGGTWK